MINIKEKYDYNPNTGDFTHKTGRFAGKVAGRVSEQGYRFISTGHKEYRAHRLAFLFMEGHMPDRKLVVDHINNIKDDNRWSNLRKVNDSTNAKNHGIQENNTSGVVGIARHKQHKKWRAFITVDRKWHHLGYFKNKADAVAARKEAEKQFEWNKPSTVCLKKVPCITQAELKARFQYEAGNLIRLDGIKKGQIAGFSNGGYWMVRPGKRVYRAHVLVWLYHHGYIPENSIDHIDGDKLNNRIENLREVTNQCNIRNTGNFFHNTSGVKGVSWFKRDKKWKAHVAVNRKTHHLGYYRDFNEAVCARLAAEQCINWSGCGSNSPAYLYVKEMLNEYRQNTAGTQRIGFVDMSCTQGPQEPTDRAELCREH